MPQTPGSYDESLLRDAPAATKEQIQEGYNPELLSSPSRHRSVHRSPAPPPAGAAPPTPPVPHQSATDLEQGPVSNHGSRSHTPHIEKQIPTRNVPFWRSKTGKIVIAVVVFVIVIAAVVGGAVGGTRGRKHNNAAPSKSSTAVGVGPAGTPANGVGSTTSSTLPVPDLTSAFSVSKPTSTSSGSNINGSQGSSISAEIVGSSGPPTAPGEMEIQAYGSRNLHGHVGKRR